MIQIGSIHVCSWVENYTFLCVKAGKGKLRKVIVFELETVNTAATLKKLLFLQRRCEGGDMGGHRVLLILDLPFYPV